MSSSIHTRHARNTRAGYPRQPQQVPATALPASGPDAYAGTTTSQSILGVHRLTPWKDKPVVYRLMQIQGVSCRGYVEAELSSALQASSNDSSTSTGTSAALLKALDSDNSGGVSNKYPVG